MADFSVDIDTGKVRAQLKEFKEQWATDAVYITGTNADYAIYLERGRGPVEAQDAEALQFQDENGNTIYRASVSGHKPYPFFRPAILEFQANPEKVIRNNTGYQSLEEIPSGKALVEAAASAIENQAKKNASADSATDRSPGTDPDHPKRDTGNLVASIQSVRLK